MVSFRYRIEVNVDKWFESKFACLMSLIGLCPSPSEGANLGHSSSEPHGEKS